MNSDKQTLFGLRVITSPLCENVPRMIPSAEFCRIQHPDLVASTEAWMLKFFGVSDVMYVITDPISGSKRLVMSSRDAQKAQRAMP